MLLNEAEARTKWCPHVRVEGNNRLHNAVTGGFSNEDTAFRCVAHDCMAWREHHLKFTHGDADAVIHGYCGLSGKPAVD